MCPNPKPLHADISPVHKGTTGLNGLTIDESRGNTDWKLYLVQVGLCVVLGSGSGIGVQGRVLNKLEIKKLGAG